MALYHGGNCTIFGNYTICALYHRWQLYHTRCALDICVSQRQRLLAGEGSYRGGGAGSNQTSLFAAEVRGQVYAKCSFCSQSLVTGGLRPNLPPSRTAGRQLLPPRKPSACPSCKKPLPRCALCHHHLGCPDPAEAMHARPTAQAQTAPSGFSGGVSSAYGHWMVWCQTCRHGGHAIHLEQVPELLELLEQLEAAPCVSGDAVDDLSLTSIPVGQLASRPTDQRVCLLLAACCFCLLLAACCLLLAACCFCLPLAAYYFLLPTCCLLLATCNFLLTTCYMLLATYYLLLATYYLLITTGYFLLPTSYFLLAMLATCCLLLATYYIATCYLLLAMLAAYYLLLTTCYLLLPTS